MKDITVGYFTKSVRLPDIIRHFQKQIGNLERYRKN